MTTPNHKADNSILKFHAGDSLWRNIFSPNSSPKESVFNTLRKVPVFKGMNKSELKEFDKIIHRRKYKEDETIFWEGEPGVGMYIVQEGSVAIYKDTSQEEKEILAELTRGEFFGELALLDETPRSATAVATENSKVLGLFRPDLIDLIERKPRLGNKFLFQLAMLIGERLKHTNEELQALWNKLEESKVIT
ncbi:cyclic nucleotide-binding domain-containing protein [candidate division KSB1 bacterium]|nr:cyclic nucleotide-binding domain-containing protein [candidate division KSB1 bacterium]NIR72486.1 cyclic nucleotide-binding domain-containing protein [candidate division KSB1 bacterium]NIS24071.1 cyclic nucleotide-binding domain-containing protein [candidate division KSB1 bacterium]NIT70990.1 cyclic nucleotide-binding domain-containing protein [candidate division KSB1 bacterium]NIU27401.1 cyclic nucleotide-binding domain-containing protein [candidate division KSB1 bacterium]